MKKSLVHRVARWLWIVPVALFLLTLNQGKVAYDLHYTLKNGVRAVAEVIEVEVNERVDIPFGYLSLRVVLDDGSEIVQEKMSLPYTLLPSVRYADTLAVRLFPEADQPIVIEEIANTQWKIAGIQSLMSFVGFLMAAAGVYAWNRLLNREGDPAAKMFTTPERN